MERENQSFLRELDTAIDEIQRWKYRPAAEDSEAENLKEEFEVKAEIGMEMEELQGRYADEEKVSPPAGCDHNLSDSAVDSFAGRTSALSAL